MNGVSWKVSCFLAEIRKLHYALLRRTGWQVTPVHYFKTLLIQRRHRLVTLSSPTQLLSRLVPLGISWVRRVQVITLHLCRRLFGELLNSVSITDRMDWSRQYHSGTMRKFLSSEQYVPRVYYPLELDEVSWLCAVVH